MRYINPRFTYLLTYLLTILHRVLRKSKNLQKYGFVQNFGLRILIRHINRRNVLRTKVDVPSVINWTVVGQLS